jgi:hypothetical protein
MRLLHLEPVTAAQIRTTTLLILDEINLIHPEIDEF